MLDSLSFGKSEKYLFAYLGQLVSQSMLFAKVN